MNVQTNIKGRRLRKLFWTSKTLCAGCLCIGGVPDKRRLTAVTDCWEKSFKFVTISVCYHSFMVKNGLSFQSARSVYNPVISTYNGVSLGVISRVNHTSVQRFISVVSKLIVVNPMLTESA